LIRLDMPAYRTSSTELKLLVEARCKTDTGALAVTSKSRLQQRPPKPDVTQALRLHVKVQLGGYPVPREAHTPLTLATTGTRLVIALGYATRWVPTAASIDDVKEHSYKRGG